MIRTISQSGSAEASYSDASGLATHEAIKRLGDKLKALRVEKDYIKQITVATGAYTTTKASGALEGWRDRLGRFEDLAPLGGQKTAAIGFVAALFLAIDADRIRVGLAPIVRQHGLVVGGARQDAANDVL